MTITYTRFVDDYGQKARLHFEYAAGIVEAVKTIKGRWYDPESKSWSIPFDRLHELEAKVGVIREHDPHDVAVDRIARDLGATPAAARLSQPKPQRTDRILEVLEDIAGSLRILAQRGDHPPF